MELAEMEARLIALEYVQAITEQLLEPVQAAVLRDALLALQGAPLQLHPTSDSIGQLVLELLVKRADRIDARLRQLGP